jgi:uncharacterized membrane protein
MVDIHHQCRCAAPLATTFGYVDDFTNAPHWMFGLSALTPAPGSAPHGLGAVFEGSFSVPPVRLSATIEITEWEQDAVIAYRSVKGFRNWSTWRFRSEGPEQTLIDVDFSYELPGGLAGKALGRALEPVIALTVNRSDAAARREIEAVHAASGG